MKFYWLTLGSLAIWRVTHLLNTEDGPWDVFVWLRKWAGDGLWGDLLDCFYCLSMCVAIPVAAYLGESGQERLLLWPALSAAAILLERVSSRERKTDAEVDSATAEYSEVPEETNDVLLRQKARRVKDASRIH